MTGKFDLSQLSQSTEYESYLLEAVYSIANQPLVNGRPDELNYLPATEEPQFIRFASINMTLGDWRPGFINAGAPLIFTTAFMLLDMIVEWILQSNGLLPDHRFAIKISQLDRSLVLPPLMQQCAWLFPILVGLYKELAPLRGTVIHQRHFKSENGNLVVSASKKGAVGEPVPISAAEVRTLSQVLVTTVRSLEGIWEMDEFAEKLLASRVDTLAQLHKMRPTGQQAPILLKVRLFRTFKDDLYIDVAAIREEADGNSPRSESMFDIEVIGLAPIGSTLEAFRLPWQIFRDHKPTYSASRSMLAQYATSIPDDINQDDIVATLRERAR